MLLINNGALPAHNEQREMTEGLGIMMRAPSIENCSFKLSYFTFKETVK